MILIHKHWQLLDAQLQRMKSSRLQKKTQQRKSKKKLKRRKLFQKLFSDFLFSKYFSQKLFTENLSRGPPLACECVLKQAPSAVFTRVLFFMNEILV